MVFYNSNELFILEKSGILEAFLKKYETAEYPIVKNLCFEIIVCSQAQLFFLGLRASRHCKQNNHSS